MNLIHLVQDGVQWRVAVNTVTNIRIIRKVEYSVTELL